MAEKQAFQPYVRRYTVKTSDGRTHRPSDAAQFLLLLDEYGPEVVSTKVRVSKSRARRRAHG